MFVVFVAREVFILIRTAIFITLVNLRVSENRGTLLGSLLYGLILL